MNTKREERSENFRVGVGVDTMRSIGGGGESSETLDDDDHHIMVRTSLPRAPPS